VRLRGAAIPFLDQLLFTASESADICQVWDKRLAAAHTDRELLHLAVVAQTGNGGAWLERTVRSDAGSERRFIAARAYTLAAFIVADWAVHFLTEYNERRPEKWLRDLCANGLDEWNRNGWAQHWFAAFLHDSDSDRSWAAWQLFLKTVDSRFVLWKNNIQPLLPKHPRARFVNSYLRAVEKAAEENEKRLDKIFLGHQVLARQLWPWMNHG
jgi:hypothetical protein